MSLVPIKIAENLLFKTILVFKPFVQINMEKFLLTFTQKEIPSKLLVEQRAKSSEQRAKSNEERVKSNKQRTKSN